MTLSACGSAGDETAGGSSTAVPAATTAVPAATIAATPPAHTQAQTTPQALSTTATSTSPTGTSPPATGHSGGATAGEGQTGGAGDEQPARVPAAFTVTAGSVAPRSVSVPAYLAVELDLTSGDGRLHRVHVGKSTLVVPPGGRVRQTVEGLRPGRYPVRVDGRRSSAALVTGAQPGP